MQGEGAEEGAPDLEGLQGREVRDSGEVGEEALEGQAAKGWVCEMR